MLNIFKWIKNKIFMSKVQYIGQKVIQLGSIEKGGLPTVAYDDKRRYGIAKKNNEYVAHILNQYFEGIGVVSMAKDYGEELKWPFAFFVDQFDTFNDDDVNALISKSFGFIKYKYDNMEFVCMLDDLYSTLVKIKLEVTETPDKITIVLKKRW